MALHDLWHFENAPVGLNLSVSAYQTAYNNNTIYNQYTGNTGQPVYVGSNLNTWSVSADGFLVNLANASGTAGALFVPTNAVQDWSVATQYWIGFRTKTLTANTGVAASVCGMASNANFTTTTSFLTEAQMVAAGGGTPNVEHYIEIFLDRTAQIFQTYMDGLLVNSGVANTNIFTSATFLYFGLMGTAAAGFARGFRDFYFLDVDANNPGRLGPMRAKATAVASATGSEWVPNGAADLLTALTTATQNPPLSTPNVQSPVDNQPLVLTLTTNVVDAGQKVIAVQPTLAIQAGSGGTAKANAAFKDTANHVQALGQIVNGNGALQLNQKLPLSLTAPDGTAWTGAKINQAQYVLTPTT